MCQEREQARGVQELSASLRQQVREFVAATLLGHALTFGVQQECGASFQGCPVLLPATTKMAADCFPRISPPAACAAFKAINTRSAKSFPLLLSNALAIAAFTLSPNIILLCTE